MQTNWIKGIAISVCSLLSLSLHGQSTPDGDILFIGNSYTYFWNLPQTLEVMLQEKGFDHEITHSTIGGANLRHHWRGERGLESQQLVRSAEFELVVLQDHSQVSIEYPDSLITFGKQWADLISQSGSKTILYETWAREWDPYQQETISEKYAELANVSGAKLAPVGQAWKRAKDLRPELQLYDEDESHPSPTGTYLTACVFFKVLTGKSPVGLPHRIKTKDEDGDLIYLNIQSRENALFCQKVADEIVTKTMD